MIQQYQTTQNRSTDPENVYFEKWFLVKTEKDFVKNGDGSVINVATDSGKEQLCRLIISKNEKKMEEQNNNKKRTFLNFVFMSREDGDDISVRNILMKYRGEDEKGDGLFGNDPENEEYVRLLRSFVITFKKMNFIRNK